jgi:hypothetical protein
MSDNSLTIAGRWSATQILLPILAIIAAAIFVFVCMYTPLFLLSNAAGDDGLFITLGMQIANGKWLGPFNVFTLAKGSGYPLFLAVSHYSGLPVTVSQAMLLVLSLALFCYMAGKVARSQTVGYVLFVATILHPTFIMERILRDAIYTSQVFLVIGLLIAAFYVYPRRSFFWGAAAGLVLSWFWVTREEGIWIAPAIAALVGFALVKDWFLRREWRPAALGLVGFALFFAAGQAAVSTTNWFVYGRFQTVDIKEANFTMALSALQSVQDGEQIPYVPVSRSTRKIIYEVSPTFASMRNTFDPPDGKTPDHGCKFYPWTCGDIAGGWFMFHLKGSAAIQGAYKNPDAAIEFFARLNAEVAAACHDGRLTCRANPIPFMPRVTMDQILDLPAKLWDAGYFLVSPERWILPRASTGTPQQIADAVAFLNDPTTAESAAGKIRPSLVSAANFIRTTWTPIYAWAMTALLPVGMLAFLAATILAWQRKAELQLTAIAGALWLLLFARLGLIAMIAISAFPTINKWYLNPALYLSVPASLLSIFILLRLWRARRAAQQFLPRQ